MSNQVLPVARGDGYYLVDKGCVTFVPLEKRGRVIPFPAKLRFVSRRADQIDAHLDEIDGYRGDE
ncbi:hypothetical protein [Mesorhizobium sp. M1399]|uniref:hypothetical protein n=1 Tax=Mesorhizobium sp. M1399 TaxID=2957096 RepID=UPI003338515B